MKFHQPDDRELTVRKGEFFTVRDVPCPSCGANPGEKCISRSARLEPRGRAGSLVEREALEPHFPRRHLHKGFVELLLKKRALRFVTPPPFWVPPWAHCSHNVGGTALGTRVWVTVAYEVIRSMRVSLDAWNRRVA